MATEKNDILSQIKEIEAKKKQALLVKKVNELKIIAKKINELKAETEILLEEIGVSKEDGKRVIDFVNELDDVKLTERERETLRTKAKTSVITDRKEIEGELEKIITKVAVSGYANLAYRKNSDEKFNGYVTDHKIMMQTPPTGITWNGSSLNNVTCLAGDTHSMNAFTLQSGSKTLDIKL